jgi:outer membrane receptor for ferrienterochelin and colicins
LGGFNVGAALAVLCIARPAVAQQQQNARAQAPVASVSGIIRDATGGQPLTSVSVLLDGRRADVSRRDGTYRLSNVATGSHIIGLRRIGFRPRDFTVSLTNGDTRTLDLVFDAQPVPLGLVNVVAASRRPQRLLDAPAAITVISAERIADLAPLGQTPMLFADLPGVHVRQSGAFEFNLNTRGFNSTTARRMLVLVDGRDISVPLLGNQEWSDFSQLDDAARVELVRGPGSALYGANAFGGVLSITTPSVREAQGLRVSVAGGAPSTLRTDISVARVSPNGAWGYRAAVGAMQGASWDQSRTDSLALAREYANAHGGIPRGPAPGYEYVPLRGQSTGASLGQSAVARGDIEPTLGWYANARADRYRSNGQILTAEGGVSHTDRLMSTVSTGRSQTLFASRPWARLAWTDSSFTLFAYYNGRTGESASLAAPSVIRETSGTLHIEGQYDHAINGTRGRITVGASARDLSADTHGTLLSPEGDGTSTYFGALFGQFEYNVAPTLRAIFAARGDVGSRDDPQFSPKLGLAWSVAPTHVIRTTFSRGYLVPPLLARFLQVDAGPPLDLRALEAGLRASPLGPALGGVAPGALFTNSAAVPLLARGNTSLGTERINSFEVGYKGQLRALYLSASAYYNQIDGFLSPLLPGGNRAFGAWTAPAAVPGAARSALEGAVLGAVGSGLTRLADGRTAFVLSGGNAGRATERGVELEGQWRAGQRWLVDANYAWIGFTINQNSFTPGDTVLSNTPSNTGNASVTYTHGDGTRARVGVRMSDAFNWRNALWIGRVPSMTSVDAVVSRPLNGALRASVAATNLLDQSRYQFFGGSLVRRRVIVSLAWRP